MEDSNGEALEATLTRLIGQIDAGDEAAQAKLCDLVYQELREIGRRARRRYSNCTLATTEVVHEFLGRVLADGRLGQMKNRRYFYAAAADQMRRLIIDHWRHRQTQVDGGRLPRENLDPWLDELAESAASRCGGDLDAMNAALAQLKSNRPRQYEIVLLKFFAGLANQQVAETLGISIDTVKRDWQIARARIEATLSNDS